MARPIPELSAQISWVYCDDIDSAARFYADILGLECSRDEGDARIYATAGGASIGVCRAFANREVEPRGGMISLVCDDVDAWYRQLRERGLEIDKPPQRIDAFGIYTFFVEDPNGYIIEFQQFLDP